MKDILSTVTPWPAVVETLDFVLTNCSRDENNHPEIIFREKTDKEIESLDKPSAYGNAYGVESLHMLPKISVSFDIKNREERVRIWIKDNLPGPDGNTVEEKILQSPLAYLFECYTSCWQSVGLQLADDELARLVTYVLELTGYTEDTELDIEKYFDYGCGDKSKVIIADQDIDCSAILRTFDIIRELRIEPMDWMEMSLSAAGDKEPKLRLLVYSDDSEVEIFSQRIIDSEELELLRGYRNFDFLRIDYSGNYMCKYMSLPADDPEFCARFLTDYFNYKNGTTSSAPVVTLTILPEENLEESSGWDGRYTQWHIYPDGTESPQSDQARFIDILGRVRVMMSEEEQQEED